MPTLSSRVAPGVVAMTTSGAFNDVNVGIDTTLWYFVIKMFDKKCSSTNDL